MAATARRSVSRREGKIIFEVPLKAAGVVYENCAVAIDMTTGYAENFTAAANKQFVGFAMESVDNTSGSAGALSVRVMQDVEIEVKSLNTLTQSALGRIAYLTDNETVGLSCSYLVSTAKWKIPGGKITEIIAAQRARINTLYGTLQGTNAT